MFFIIFILREFRNFVSKLYLFIELIKLNFQFIFIRRKSIKSINKIRKELSENRQFFINY